MGEPTSQDGSQLTQLLAKFAAWLAYIVLGVTAKLAMDSRNAKLSWPQIITKAVLSIFVGSVSFFACESFSYMRFAPVIVPVSTLLGEGIAVYFISNWTRWFEKYYPWFRKNKDASGGE